MVETRREYGFETTQGGGNCQPPRNVRPGKCPAVSKVDKDVIVYNIPRSTCFHALRLCPVVSGLSWG